MLQSQLFAQNARLNQAFTNSPPMRRGERDTAAVALLQQALRDLNIATMRRSINADGTFDGVYAGETVEAVRKFQEDNGMTNGRRHGDGVVGSDTLGALDFLAAAAGLTPVAPAPPSSVAPSVETQSTLPVGDPPTALSRINVPYVCRLPLVVLILVFICVQQRASRCMSIGPGHEIVAVILRCPMMRGRSVFTTTSAHSGISLLIA